MAESGSTQPRSVLARLEQKLNAPEVPTRHKPDNSGHDVQQGEASTSTVGLSATQRKNRGRKAAAKKRKAAAKEEAIEGMADGMTGKPTSPKWQSNLKLFDDVDDLAGSSKQILYGQHRIHEDGQWEWKLADYPDDEREQQTIHDTKTHGTNPALLASSPTALFAPGNALSHERALHRRDRKDSKTTQSSPNKVFQRTPSRIPAPSSKVMNTSLYRRREHTRRGIRNEHDLAHPVASSASTHQPSVESTPRRTQVPEDSPRMTTPGAIQAGRIMTDVMSPPDHMRGLSDAEFSQLEFELDTLLEELESAEPRSRKSRPGSAEIIQLIKNAFEPTSWYPTSLAEHRRWLIDWKREHEDRQVEEPVPWDADLAIFGAEIDRVGAEADRAYAEFQSVFKQQSSAEVPDALSLSGNSIGPRNALQAHVDSIRDILRTLQQTQDAESKPTGLPASVEHHLLSEAKTGGERVAVKLATVERDLRRAQPTRKIAEVVHPRTDRINIAERPHPDHRFATMQGNADRNGTVKASKFGGGHGYASYALGGADGFMIIDSSRHQEITVNKEQKTAKVGMGVKLGPLAEAIGKEGFGLPHGTCSSVGVVGHALGGGWGFSSRNWGWLMDHIIAITLVDPTGAVREVSEASTGTDVELWWGQRGAGANNFGVVTDITFALEEAPAQAVNWKTTFPTNEECATVLRTIMYVGLSQATPNSLSEKLGVQLLGYGESSGNPGACSLSGQVPGPLSGLRNYENVISDELRNRGVVMQPFNATEFPSWVETLTDLMGNLSAPANKVPYYAQSLLDDGYPSDTEKGAAAIFEAVQQTVNISSTGTSLSFDLNGPAHGNSSFAAAGHRKSLFLSQIYTWGYPSFNDAAAQDQVNTAVDNVNKAVRADDSEGTWRAYVNYVDPRLQDWAQAYYGEGLDRLKQLKKDVDPQTLFDYPQGLAHA
ncbi:Putative berberine/berberine, FAD-binding domain, PCMH-type, FAD-binding, type PCMH, subdomain 2 [Septoria linicola]|uniref:Berberine/berberine, FAD-binding domain, PCMH-type, FAD-binding, type PCMH, subdomain 2 n=1 Tax=Septoria linicola TaxID=215465 RepID=A0A9Q9B5L1_9PEZI|nr:putative berberine/berberine, FAD-binding domain, PCMH-type, FAD-binding, type PCMH, subdomain 2 [Septoria linicola]USW56756.1 Putative berberine/berberine, FAD-binding domain, PCMH-type, FAD-binding, type PCMH, subdomain 2 [Septoria linicola]